MIKDIAVHLTGSGEDEIRLAYAESISERLDAHITGLYVHIMPQMVDAYPTPMIGMEAWLGAIETRAGEDFARLQGRFGRLTMPNDVRRLDVVRASAGRAVAAEAITADLFVATRPYGDPDDDAEVQLGVLFGAGRSCLFVPPQQAATPLFGTVLIAWNGSKQSARAVAEAMPFLHQAGQIIIVAINERGETIEGSAIARHLSRHGLSTVIGAVELGTMGPGRALLDEAQRVGANLLVMGGYGHARWIEWVMGGATREVLSQATIPVLMAH